MNISDSELEEFLVEFERIAGAKLTLDEARPVAELIIRLVEALYEP